MGRGRWGPSSVGREGETGWHPQGATLAGGGAPLLAWALSPSGAPWSPRFRALTLPQGPGPGYLRAVEIVWVWEGDVAAQPVVGSSRPLGGVGTPWPEVGGRQGAERLLGHTLPPALPAAEPTVPIPRGSSFSCLRSSQPWPSPAPRKRQLPASLSAAHASPVLVTTQPMGHLESSPALGRWRREWTQRANVASAALQPRWRQALAQVSPGLWTGSWQGPWGPSWGCVSWPGPHLASWVPRVWTLHWAKAPPWSWSHPAVPTWLRPHPGAGSG